MIFTGRGQVRGFTLLELLIALAIFGLLSVMSYSGLKTVMDQHAQTDEAADRLVEMQKLYLVMQRDLEQIVPRTIRGEYGDIQPAFAGSEVMEFTRGGWSNPLAQPRSSLQRVGYAFEDEELVRYRWQVLDRAQDSQPLKQPLTAAVSNMTVRYLSPTNEWSASWPDVAALTAAAVAGSGALPDDLPRAVEVTLEHDRFGELVWLFRVPQ